MVDGEGKLCLAALRQLGNRFLYDLIYWFRTDCDPPTKEMK